MIANKLFFYCENYFKLYHRQISGQKKRSAIDAINILVHTIHEKYKEKKLTAILFMDVKRAFEHISKGQLLNWIIEFDIDSEFMN